MSIKRYSKYKDSGMDFVSTIPLGWEIKPLKYATICNRDVLSENTNEDTELNYIEIGSVEYCRGINNIQKIIFSNAPSRARRIVHMGDTIISTVRTYLKAIVYIEEKYDNYICSTGFAVFTPKVGVDGIFLSYALLCHSFISEVERHSVGVSYPAITSTALASLKVILPPINMQKLIATYLDRHTAEIDGLITSLGEQITMLKKYYQIIIHDAVTGRIKVTKTSGKTSAANVKIKLKYVVQLRTEIGHYTCDDQYIGLENVESFTGRYIKTDSVYNDGVYCIVKKGDVLFSKLRPYLAKAMICEFNGFVTNEFIVFKNFAGNKLFLLYYLLSDGFIKAVDASTYGVKMPRASWDFIGNQEIILPPIEEQAAIIAYINYRATEIDKLIANTNSQIEKLKKYRQVIIHDAVTGKIKITEGSNNAN